MTCNGGDRPKREMIAREKLFVISITKNAYLTLLMWEKCLKALFLHYLSSNEKFF